MSRYAFALGFALGLACLGVAAPAAIYDVDLHNQYVYGNVSQLTPGINNGNVACGPTSALNSFVYLQNRYGVNLVPDINQSGGLDLADEIAVINNLSGLMQLGAGGVTDQNYLNGKIQYIANRGLQNQITVEAMGTNIMPVAGATVVQGPPTWQFLLAQLEKGQDVEVGIVWGGTGNDTGHLVTANSFYFNDVDNDLIIDPNEIATMNFVDPWGGVQLVGTLTMGGVNNAFMILTYNGGASGPSGDPLNPQGFNFGTIDLIVAESVPEPASLVILALGALALCGRRRRA